MNRALRRLLPTRKRQCRRLPEWSQRWTRQFLKILGPHKPKEKERDWWSIDLRCEVEELEEGDPWTITGGKAEGEMRHQPNDEKAAVEEGKKRGKIEK